VPSLHGREIRNFGKVGSQPVVVDDPNLDLFGVEVDADEVASMQKNEGRVIPPDKNFDTFIREPLKLAIVAIDSRASADYG
jgi:hypothetical protein